MFRFFCWLVVDSASGLKRKRFEIKLKFLIFVETDVRAVAEKFQMGKTRITDIVCNKDEMYTKCELKMEIITRDDFRH